MEPWVWAENFADLVPWLITAIIMMVLVIAVFGNLIAKIAHFLWQGMLSYSDGMLSAFGIFRR